MPVTSDKARDWATIFPHHPILWVSAAALLVVLLARKTPLPPAPPAVTQPATNTEPRPPDRAERARQYSWLTERARRVYEPLADRIEPPPGFRRVPFAPGSPGDWLRHLPALPPGTPVSDARGRPVRSADDPAVAAVLDLRPGQPRLLHAANAVIRLRAEYLWTQNRPQEMRFTLTNGAAYGWERFLRGERPVVSGRQVQWKTGAAAGTGREAFTAYVETLFPFSSGVSLKRDTREVSSDEAVEAGDVLVMEGIPGRAAVVLDVARDASDRRVVLIGHGGVPPHTLFVVRAASGSAWFDAARESRLLLPTWPELDWKHLRRWPESAVDAPSAE